MKTNLAELLLEVKTFEAKYNERLKKVCNDITYYVHGVPNPNVYDYCDGRVSQFKPSIMKIFKAVKRLYAHPNDEFTNEKMFTDNENFIKIRKPVLQKKAKLNDNPFRTAMEELDRVGIIDKEISTVHIKRNVKGKKKNILTDYYVRINWQRMAYIIDNIDKLKYEYKPAAYLEEKTKEQAEELLKKGKGEAKNDFDKFRKSAEYAAKVKAGLTGETVETTTVASPHAGDVDITLFSSIRADAVCRNGLYAQGAADNAISSKPGTEKEELPGPERPSEVISLSKNPDPQAPFTASLDPDTEGEDIRHQLNEFFGGKVVTLDNMCQIRNLQNLPLIYKLTPETLRKVLDAISGGDIGNNSNFHNLDKLLDRKSWTSACSAVLKLQPRFDLEGTLYDMAALDAVVIRTREIIHECKYAPEKAKDDFSHCMRLIQSGTPDDTQVVFACTYVFIARKATLQEFITLRKKVTEVFAKNSLLYTVTDTIVKWDQYLTISDTEKSRYASIFEHLKYSIRWTKRQAALLGITVDGHIEKMLRATNNDRSSLVNRIAKESGVYDPFPSIWAGDYTSISA